MCFALRTGRFVLSSCTPPFCLGSGTRGSAGFFRAESRRFTETIVQVCASFLLRERTACEWRGSINNSLAPIKSIARSLETLVSRESLPDDWRADVDRGLSVIASRADSLGRFTAAYARLARLPRPQVAPLELDPLVRRVASLETRLPIDVRAAGPPVYVQADQDRSPVQPGEKASQGTSETWHDQKTRDDGPAVCHRIMSPGRARLPGNGCHPAGQRP